MLRSALKNSWHGLRSLRPFSRLKAGKKNRIAVLMYHEILKDSDKIENWMVVKECDFIQQIDYLKRFFKVISLEKALQLMRGENEISENLAVVTLDDGYAGNKRGMWPIIEAKEIPVTVFVSTEAVQNQSLYWYDQVILSLQPGDNKPFKIDLEPVGLKKYKFGPRIEGEQRWDKIETLLTDLKALSPEKRAEVVKMILEQGKKPSGEASPAVSPMSIEELREMAGSKYVTFGAHSHCHNILTQLDKETARKSVESSKNLLESWTGLPVRYFAYPNGDFNGSVIENVKESGFLCGMSTVAKSWEKSDSFFKIPRYGIG